MFPTKTDSRRRLNATAYLNVENTKAAADTTEPDGFVNEQWTAPNVDESTPWKTIAIIITLFIGGTTCICCAALDWLADANQNRSDRIWALIIIGVLTIIPGGYYFYILSCILMRRQGYTMDDIRRLG
ncbi:transmembrane protein 230 [Drosophila grimshawi]|uniref:Transmembrane protein 230 n=1 Tax=Drosophila grimshawi TaxID=7222 RepID=B4JAI6_DROGR|nr:transmembrane protein 230 [Drosophila grimshawi]EDW02772.1 GH10874 [Drosophila grimshawi]